MRLKLFFLLFVTAILPGFAQTASVTGSVVDADTGAPVKGVTLTLVGQGKTVTTGPSGEFIFSNLMPGDITIATSNFGYQDSQVSSQVFNNQTVDLGKIKLNPDNLLNTYYEEQQDMFFDEVAMDDEDGSAQNIAALTGASDNIYYNASNYNFSTMFT